MRSHIGNSIPHFFLCKSKLTIDDGFNCIYSRNFRNGGKTALEDPANWTNSDKPPFSGRRVITIALILLDPSTEYLIFGWLAPNGLDAHLISLRFISRRFRTKNDEASEYHGSPGLIDPLC